MNRFGNLVFSLLSQPKYSITTMRKHMLIPTSALICTLGRNLFVGATPDSPLFMGYVPRLHTELRWNKKVYLFDRKTMSSIATQHLELDGGRRIAYKLTVGDQTKPTVVYVPGLMNTMEESKAVALNKFCESSHLTLIRFDFEGVGESPGNIEKIFFGNWIDDLRHIVNKVSKTPVIYVAFSMGGWISTKIAIEMPEKLHSILYVAPGFNFLQYYYGIFYEKLPPELKKTLDDGGCIYYNDLFMRKDFSIESVNHHINLKEKIPITAPIRFLHGMLDRDAPFKVSLDLLSQFESSDVDLYLRKSGKHQMTDPSDLALMTHLLNELVQKYPLNK